ncbi:hypothetical protein A2673_03090 [Candidatus Kaiserbacteria bacterium RIFCSPHIGHO2_01_FULL_50_13]|uniref:Uncharacterized protein n=1 Tax=Candidatus Kaiserbacteria bacterium RIFCSPLOWO2_01_FULL_50_24 TaxID=1798507 RepID=A0A1F6ERF9_9BACT|nr:MAG: hypothetical protein A2673_03090 [Candidatus Kaiserbacteria bacterium RIFCSPHIGHO2_01_FULL_50_13]OGG76207.1 MAG: hypothetical protein A3A34_01820 [Candidatus Kaiserbacteria bacterium RIFCSPLOWO2_01_FULL_50_24]OGG81118.1 MAG: hypothetical protein A3H74_01520 [Candidatus Kaiserbacteria bacterium RIFCSPLOWO2_02_FULL_51_13]
MHDGWKSAIKIAVGVFVFSVVYLYLRRFGLPISDVYIKLSFTGVAVVGIVLIAHSYLVGSLAHFWPRAFEAKKSFRKYYGLTGFYLIIVHSAWGVFLKLNPDYYAKHFDKIDPARVQLVDIPFALGLAGLLLFVAVAAVSLPVIAKRMTPSAWLFIQRLGYIALTLGTIHFALIKWKGFLAYHAWPYFLPPLSLLIFIFIIFVFVMRLAQTLTLALCLLPDERQSRK